MKKIICLGDSLTEGAGLEPQRTWPALVANGLAGAEVLNQGIGGDTTGGMLARFAPLVVPQQPDLVVILGGCNDLWFGLDPRIIAANLFAVVSQAKYHKIAPLLATPLPFVSEIVETQPWLPPPEGYGAMARQLEQLRDALTTAAGHSEILCLDLHTEFCDSDGNVQRRYFMEDGLHPNYPGHQRIARALLRVLRAELLCGQRH